MPTTVRGLYRPRRRLIKPRGKPTFISSLAPRGLVLCAPLSDPSFMAVYAGTVAATGSFALKPTATSSPTLTATPRGAGLRLNGGVTCLSYQMPSVQPPNTWSMEALIWVDSKTAEGSICGFNQSSDGSNGTFDRDIGTNLNGTGNWQAYIFDGGGPKSANGPVSSTTGFLHFVATADGGNLRFYYNGSLQNTTVVANGGFTGYSPPVYFCIGRVSGSSFPFASCTVLLVNLAKVCWTPAEVQARYLNPYGFLAWSEERRNYLVGVTGTGAQNLSPSLFTNTTTFFSPTVGRGAVNLAPSLFTNTSTFFAPTVSSVTNLTPSLFTNSNTFFSPTVVSAGNLAPSLFTNTNTFFSPTVTPGAVNLAPSLFANSNIFYSPTVALAQPQALLPSLYTNPNIFFLPVVHSHIVLVNVYVKLLAPHVFSAQEYPTDTVFGPDQSTIPPDFQYTPLMEGLSGDSISAIAQTNIDVFGRYDAHGNLLDNPPIPRPIYDPQPTPAVGDKHFLPLGNGSWP